MLTSGLLIHIGDGRIEMHFHVFGSLAFLSIYRDWRGADTGDRGGGGGHILRGIFFPLSIYGVIAQASGGGWNMRGG